MRQIRFVLICAAVILSACHEIETDTAPAGQGEISISLSAEADVVPVAKSLTESEVPDVNEFDVEIYKKVSGSRFIRLYRDTYADFVGKRIPLNAGEYRLLAQHGDSAGVGFNAIWFMADKDFTVNPQTNETIDAVARMSKVKVAVEYGYNIMTDYQEYYVKVKNKEGKALHFSHDETRAGYIPAGELTVEVYAKIDGEWKYSVAKVVDCRPSDYMIFKVDTKPGIGSAMVSVTINRETELIEKELEIPDDMLPKYSPVLNVNGFDGGVTADVVEAMAISEDTRVDIVAKGKIAACMLKVKSEYLGLDQEVDLVNADETVRASFKEKGITWLRDMAGKTLSYVDFSAFVKGIAGSHCNPELLKELTFELKVTDTFGQETVSGEYRIAEKKPEFSFAAYDWNYYARRIDHLSAEVQTGNPEAVSIQYYNGSEWIPVQSAGVSGNTMKYSAVTGLEPETDYSLRAVYNGNEHLISDTYTFRTEAAANVGNAGFEEWTTEIFEYTAFYKKKTCDWYLPRTVDSWWAVNSKKTMRSYCEGDAFGIGANYNLKVFPTVSYFDNGNGRSAQLATIATGKAATNDWPGTVEVSVAAGEIWIGKATEGDFVTGGNHASDGHVFSSRPSAVAFKYQYIPENNENFYCYVELKDADGNKLFAKEIIDGPAENTGKTMTIPVTYTDYTKKAASIYMCFKSSTASSPSYSKKEIIMPNGNQTACVGSILRIDDIQLIYE